MLILHEDLTIWELGKNCSTTSSSCVTRGPWLEFLSFTTFIYKMGIRKIPVLWYHHQRHK